MRPNERSSNGAQPNIWIAIGVVVALAAIVARALVASSGGGGAGGDDSLPRYVLAAFLGGRRF
jgi:hypothetical protein